MAREFDRGTIPGSDIKMSGYQEITDLPQSGNNFDDPNPWLRKTDWCCDGIIANED
jgi:hypothetical protein